MTGRGKILVADPTRLYDFRPRAFQRPLMRRLRLIVLSLVLWTAAPALRAQDAPSPPAPPASAAALPADVTTSHSLRVGDRALGYAATVGALPLLDAKGEKRAELAYVAYLAV